MEFKAQQIAAFIQGRVIGDENAVVHTFAKIEEGKPGAISFLASPKYTHYLYETQSSVVLVDESIEVEKPVQATMIVVKNARDCVAKLLQLYESMKPKRMGVHFGYTSEWKTAIVTLKADSKPIEFFEGLN